MYIGFFKEHHGVGLYFFGDTMNNGIKINSKRECVEFSIYKKTERVRIKHTKRNNKHDR